MKLAFYKGKSFISKLIEWQTRSEFSHVAILCDDHTVYEAWEKCGVSRIEGSNAIDTLSANHTPGTEVELYDIIGMDWVRERTARIFAESQVGKKYDFRSVARFVTRFEPSHSDQEKWFCSEYAFEICRVATVSLLLRAIAAKISPGQLNTSPFLIYDRTIITK